MLPIKTRIIQHIKVENPFYLDNGFNITFYRQDYKYGVKIVNKYIGVTESSLKRLDRMVPKYSYTDWDVHYGQKKT